MKYFSGEVAELGDLVLIERGRTLGVVRVIVETVEEAKLWGLDEIGLSIEAKPFGWVFWPEAETDDPVIFVSRKGS